MAFCSTGDRLELIKKAPNDKDGKFRNLIEQPNISARYCLMGGIWNVSFKTTPTEEQLLIIT